jgi:hypothetical protein
MLTKWGNEWKSASKQERAGIVFRGFIAAYMCVCVVLIVLGVE